MSITWVGKGFYFPSICFPFINLPSTSLSWPSCLWSIEKSLLKYAWNYFSSSAFMHQWNTEHESLSGNVISSPHIAFNWSACPGYLVQVGRLKNMGLSSSLSDPLSAANMSEIFLNHLLSSARALFYLGSSLIAISKNKITFLTLLWHSLEFALVELPKMKICTTPWIFHIIALRAIMWNPILWTNCRVHIEQNQLY